MMTLVTLSLCDRGIGDAVAVVIATILQYRSDASDSLHTINISKNKIKCDGSIALSNSLKYCTNLRTLKIGRNDVSNEGVLSGGLKHCNNLHTLDISHNDTGSEGAIALSDGLRHCNNLHTLDISHNDIGNEGAIALNLHTLDIVYNHIGVEGVIALSDGLKHCNNLHILDIILNMKVLLVVVLSTVVTSINLQFVIITLGTKVSHVLEHCSNLHKLVISLNNIGHKGVSALRNSLKQCSILDIHPQRN